MDIVAENIEKLREMFPDVFTEGKVDFEALEATLGEYVEGAEERYSFNWNGKAKARRIAQTPSTGTLRPAPQESKNWDTTQNLYIEGDNLEVLKLLQKSYHKQVKMIYIDPPYNTGKDFVYKDNFKDNIKNYMEQTGQVDSEGNKLSTNSDTSGRYHSDWLNMMYPRLKLARNLLKDDGVIFISIDDNEVANLRKICDEIFGEDNFVACFPWRKRTTKSDVPFGVSQDFEWILSYAKQNYLAGVEHKRKYHYTDDFPGNGWRLSDLTTQRSESERPNSAFELIDPKTGKKYPYNPKRTWGVTKDTFDEYYKRGKIVFPDDYGFLKISIPAYRVFESEDISNSLKKYGISKQLKSVSTLLPQDIGMNEDGNKDVVKLFGSKLFSFPKPISIIKFLTKASNTENEIIFDFFSGSATTAHAVMKLNAEDGGNRQYILVQLPEETDEKSEAYKAGYKNICEIGKERIRRAGEKIVNSEELRVKSEELDIGFKVFKLDSSNIKAWDPESEDLEQSLFDAVNNIKTDRTQEDLLYEILLKYGLDLTLPIEALELAGKKVYVVGLGALVICLDEAITLDTVEEIAKLKEQYGADDLMRVVFRDNGFKDAEVKTNAIQILKQQGIDDVKSL